MKEFFVGLLFLIVVAILAGLGFLLFPLLMVLGLLLRVVIICLLFILTIWLLGKLILSVWKKIK